MVLKGRSGSLACGSGFCGQRLYRSLVLAWVGLVVGVCTFPEAAADGGWPQFGGPHGDFTVAAAGLAEAWPEAGPEKLWSRELGAGYSQVSASETAVFAFYRDGDDDVLLALEQASGQELWRHRYAAPAREGHLVQFGTGPHATPLVLEDRLITLGYAGELRALDLATGKLLWRRHLLDELGGVVTPWGFSASPIAYDGLILVPVGGAAGIVALAPDDGKVVWKSAATSASYASPLIVNVQGQDQLLYFAADALHAIDPRRQGAPLWSVEIRNGYDNHASMPVWNGKDLLWVVSQQEAGARVLRLGRQGDRATVEQVWNNPKVRVHHWNTVLLGDTVYGAIGDGIQILSAVDLATGKILWQDRTFGLSNLIHTSAGTLILTEKGELALVRLSREGLAVQARVQLEEGVYWTAPTLVGTRLFVRHKKGVTAYDLSRKPAPSPIPPEPATR